MRARNGVECAVLNLQGRTYMPPTDCPFRKADQILAGLDPAIKVKFVDFHAEVTSEKIAMGWYLDGRVSAVVGTHTHVPTADTRILPGGTAYQTDCGMTGPYHSVIGVETEHHHPALPDRPAGAHGGGAEGAELHAVIVEVDRPPAGARRAPPRDPAETERWTLRARFRIWTAFYIQEIGAVLFGIVFLFLYGQSRVVYFGLWVGGWALRLHGRACSVSSCCARPAGWLAPYATFEFAFVIVLIAAARAGFASSIKDWRTVLRLISILPIFVALV